MARRTSGIGLTDEAILEMKLDACFLRLHALRRAEGELASGSDEVFYKLLECRGEIRALEAEIGGLLCSAKILGVEY